MKTYSFNDLAINQFLRSEFEEVAGRGLGRILDLGCGSRPYVQFYDDKFEDCVAGDYDVRTASLDLRLDAQSLPFASSSFDFVLMSEVVEHLPNAEKALAEINRVLKPGGTLLITWPYNYMMHEVPHDYVRYTEFGMASRLEAAGFKVEHIVRRGNALVLALVLTEFFVGGATAWIARLPLVGWLVDHIRRAIIAVLFGIPYRAYLALSGRGMRKQSRLPGEGLKGLRGHLYHWTLGYCARVKKV